MVAGRTPYWPLALAVALVTASSSSVEAQKKPRGKSAPKLQAPQELVLGVEKSAVILLKNAAPGVSFYANVGRIVSTTETKKGLEAVYEPPTSAFPQIAIIAAISSDHSLLEWVALPLHGRPKIKIQSIPRANVVAIVGGNTFGPVLTNGTGNAQLEVVVPPGLQEVALTTTDRLGAVSKSSTALNAPDFGRVLALCPQGDSDNVLIFATTATGAPLNGAKIKLKSEVSFGETTMLRPGVYAAHIPTGSDPDAQAFVVEASLPENPTFQSKCEGKRPGTLPSAMRVRLSETSYTAGSGGSVQLTVELDYDEEQRKRKPILDVKPTLGTVSSLVRQSDTKFVGTWTLPDGFEGLEEATVTVSSQDQAKLNTKGALELKAGPSSTLSLRATARSLRADGASKTKIIATLKDSYGNGVARTPPMGEGAPTLGAFTPTKEAGRYVAVYQAPRSYSAKRVSLTVREPTAGLASNLSIALVPSKKRIVTDLRLGYTTNNGIVKAPIGSLAVALRIPLGRHYGAIGTHAGLFRSSSTEATDEGSSLGLEVVGAPVMATLAYERVLRHFTLYGGAGGGVVYSRTKLNSMNTGSRTVVKFVPGGGGFVGARLPLGPGHLVSQVSYWTAPIDDEGVRGDLMGLALEAGYGFDL